MSRLRRFTTKRAASLIVFALLFGMASRVSIDPDMWWHLRLGEYILETGDPIYADVFSHTHATQIHRNHSWLAQIIMVACWWLAGHLGLTLLVSALATGGLACLHLAGRGNIYMQGFVLVIGGACAAAFWSPRPQMFTFFFSAVLVLVLFRLKYRRQDLLWTLTPLFVLWGNCHAGYIIGFVILGLVLVGEWINTLYALGEAKVPRRKLRKLLAIALVSLMVMPINPLGLDVFAVPFDTIGISGLRHYIQEWQPPDLSQPNTWGFVLLALAVMGASLLSKRKIDAAETILVGATLGMSLVSARNLSLFAVAATPVVAIHLNDWMLRKGWVMADRSTESPGRLVINLLLVGLVLSGVIFRVDYVSRDETVESAVSLNWPAEAVRHLEAAAVAGKLFNSYNWGGFLIYTARDYPVFIDGRTDLYRNFLDEYLAAYSTDAWSTLFDKWEIGIVLVESASRLATELSTASAWQLDFSDDIASIFVRGQE